MRKGGRKEGGEKGKKKERRKGRKEERKEGDSPKKFDSLPPPSLFPLPIIMPRCNTVGTTLLQSIYSVNIGL